MRFLLRTSNLLEPQIKSERQQGKGNEEHFLDPDYPNNLNSKRNTKYLESLETSNDSVLEKYGTQSLKTMKELFSNYHKNYERNIFELSQFTVNLSHRLYFWGSGTLTTNWFGCTVESIIGFNGKL